MALRLYVPWKPQRESRRLVALAEQICNEYEAMGYNLTLRQLYYQMVARDHIPNTYRSYKNFGEIVNSGRLGGYLNWDHINDRTRNLSNLPHWRNPQSILDAVAAQFRHEKWLDQPTYVEVWVEKEALADVVGRAAQAYDVPFFSCRGYVSQSEMWAASQRFLERIEEGKNVVVIHLGDHDPSGMDMSRDIEDRINLYTQVDWNRRERGCGDEEATDEYERGEAVESMQERISEYRRGVFEDKHSDVSYWEVLDNEGHDLYDEAVLADFRGEPFELRRVALNMDQVRQYSPPPNPAKFTDSRAGEYVRTYGAQSWELAALDPTTLNGIITLNIELELDRDIWNDSLNAEATEKDQLAAVSSRWPDVVRFLEA